MHEWCSEYLLSLLYDLLMLFFGWFCFLGSLQGFLYRLVKWPLLPQLYHFFCKQDHWQVGNQICLLYIGIECLGCLNVWRMKWL